MNRDNKTFDLRDPELVGVLDDLSLWSAMAGQLLLDNVPLRPGIRLLDIACGTGFPMLELAQRLGKGSEVSGIDIWGAAIDRAAHKARVLGVTNIEFVNRDAQIMPWENGRFDLITSNLGLNNFEHPEKVLRECHRVAKPGATIALTTNLRGHMSEFYEVFESVLLQMNRMEAAQRLREHVDHRLTVEHAADLLRETGFSPDQPVLRVIPMRYASGSAMLDHTFIRMAFAEAWRKVLEPEDPQPVMDELRAALDKLASQRPPLVVTVPFAYIQATKQ